MGRQMSLLFKELKEHDPELWKELAQPNTGNLFDTSGFMRGNEILLKGNSQLANHTMLSVRYKKARKSFLSFQIGGIAFFIFLSINFAINSNP